MKSYNELRKEAWDFYSKLEPITCPALGNERVMFSRSGFNHLLRKNGALRSRPEQVRRLRLLIHIVPLLTNPKSAVVCRIEPTATFWAFSKREGGFLITTIVRQINNGQKHFFSVMNERV
jgi:hypothetical protein